MATMKAEAVGLTKKDLANTAELIVNRQDLPISATMVREAMAKR